MVITVVLRLLAGPLESGDLVGQVEHVSTGATEPVRGAADIVEFARQAMSGREPALNDPESKELPGREDRDFR